MRTVENRLMVLAITLDTALTALRDRDRACDTGVDIRDGIQSVIDELKAAAELEGAGASDARPDDQQNVGDGGSDLPTLLPHGGSTAAHAKAVETDNGCGATLAGGESGLPLRLLDWVMEHTDAGYRVGTVYGVHWLDPRDGRGFLTRGKTYGDAITKAITECATIEKASDAASGAGT